MKLGYIILLAFLLMAAVLTIVYMQTKSNPEIAQGKIDIESSPEASAEVEILTPTCTPTQRTDEYGDVTNLNQIRFSGSANGLIGDRLEVFLIGGGGVPEEDALLCSKWEKVSGASACVSDGSSSTWSFYWEDYSPHTTEYSIRARISGVDKTATAVC